MSEFGATTIRKRAKELNVSKRFEGYSGVEVVVDKETSYFAGDKTGRVFKIENQWGTQAQANNILDKIRGIQYQPYEAQGALLDPAAEIGDGITVNGVYSGIYKVLRNYSRLAPSNVSAPQDEEIDHEYPFQAKRDRAIERRFTEVNSELAIKSNEIAAKVSQVGGSSQSFGWSLLQDRFSLYSGNKEVFRADDSGVKISGEVNVTSGQIGSDQGFTVSATAIYNNITSMDDDKSSGVYIGTDGIKLGSYFKVDKTGGATIAGTIYASSGYIGTSKNGFKITASSIYKNISSFGGSGNDGVYIGANGIQLGQKFKVDSQGNLECSNATVRGTLRARDIVYGGDSGTLNGGGITGGSIGTGQLSSYCSGGIGGGYAFTNATTSQSGAATNFWATNIRSTRIYANSYLYANSFQYGSTVLSLQSKTIGGVTINYLGY